MDQSGRHVFITGGGSGIGLATARAFRNAGARVTIAGRDSTKLEETGLPHVVMDVTDETSVSDGIERVGPIDVFINNAGSATTAPALKTSRALWDCMLAVNLTAAFTCATAVLPGMIKRGEGRFIVIASIAALKGSAYTAAYTAAKHGVLGLVRALAVELATTGVTVNAVCPGFTDTPLIDDAVLRVRQKTGKSGAEILKSFTQSTPMGRLVRPEEVAAAALWLASKEAASVNGQAITIDGGETVS